MIGNFSHIPSICWVKVVQFNEHVELFDMFDRIVNF
jgi:hypothetical protein